MAQEDPTSSEKWNAGCDFAMVHLCKVLGVDPKSVNWDAATETLDGDVMAVIGNVMRAKYGEDWDAKEPSTAPASVRGALQNAVTDIKSIHEKLGERGLLNQTAAIQTLCRNALDQIDAAHPDDAYAVNLHTAPRPHFVKIAYLANWRMSIDRLRMLK